MPAKKRPAMPDIMGDVLAPATRPVEPTTLASQHDSMTVSQQNVKPAKATFYLQPALVGRLDAARLRLRSMANQEERAGITLSAIVGAAMELALRDLEENGPSSRLASMLVSQ